MPTPTFQRLTLPQFATLLQRFAFTRRINAVHMHHTWQPRHGNFRGHESIVAMWRFHTRDNGWSDIAQHLTIDPQGGLWLGRNWNLPPASASGHNGNPVAGPFMFEMVGDFDAGPGHDRFEGAQRDAALKVVALVQQRFGLEPATLRFHNMMSTKTCPGSALRYDEVLQGVALAREELLQAGSPADTAPRSAFPDDEELALQQALRSLGRVKELGGEGADAEPACTHDHPPALLRESPLAGLPPAAPAPGLDAAAMSALRPHLVNLRAGKFSHEGDATTSPADVDAIFEQHLPRWMAGRDKARVVFFAHGGLVSESSGLAIAHKHVQWWKDNGVYPIYFVWETGLFETIGQLLDRSRAGVRGAVFDPIVEEAARALGGQRLWGSMKWSAERAADPPGPGTAVGGGYYLAQQLKKFCDAHAGAVELHAVGHSAGSIFHAWFLPVAEALEVPAFESLHLLAPAIRVDQFKAHLLAPLRAGYAAHTTIYTMLRDYELADTCMGVYRKSLLYLIHHALEERRRTPILGLEESLRADADLRAFFGLDVAQPGANEVVWSVTASDSGRSASRSQAHGDFDDDAPTMNSVVRRVLGKQDADAIVEYRAPTGGARGWSRDVDWPSGLDAPGGWAAAPAPAPAAWMPLPAASPTAPASTGRRVALCMGVDEYPDPRHRLHGCANDARSWAAALGALGFETSLLLNGQATRAGMEEAIRRLLAASRAGDVLVLQYAGHGTHVHDLDGDEEDGRDEALCPVDFASGALLIDDDIALLLGTLPAGVQLTVFTDCCHSATNSRFAVGLLPQERELPPGSLARYVAPSAELERAHAEFRRQQPAGARGLRAGGTGGQEQMRHVKFSACMDHEVALESGGQGDFTRRAARILGHAAGVMSNEAFLQAVLADFGPQARQRPVLDCAAAVRDEALLFGAGGSRAAPGALLAGGREAALLQAVQALTQSVQALTARA